MDLWRERLCGFLLAPTDTGRSLVPAQGAAWEPLAGPALHSHSGGGFCDSVCSSCLEGPQSNGLLKLASLTSSVTQNSDIALNKLLPIGWLLRNRCEEGLTEDKIME